MMVVWAQNAASSIPLPPDDDYLLQPAAQFPQAPTGPMAETASQQAAAPDFESLRRLRDREQEVARREALLSNKAGALGNLEAELDRRRREAEDVKKETETMLQRNEAVLTEQKALAEQQKEEDEAQKDARLQQRVTAYSGMKAEQAGSLINSMDDDVAVAILSAMPGGKAGKVLAMVNPDKAARLTKAISEKRIDPNTLLEDEEAGGQ
jgi:flagellar motility protein MotE (MotC chaperone)